MTTKIPSWTQGILPPIDGEGPAARRSPHAASLREFLDRFGHTGSRRVLLDGLLTYRRELQKAGIVGGFQWVDGSFCEDVETTRGRPPDDIDVVTFYRLREGMTQKDFLERAPDLVRNTWTKKHLKIDGYLVDLATDTEVLVAKAAYWCGQFGHTHELRWKGLVRLGLPGPEDDAAELEWREIAKEVMNA